VKKFDELLSESLNTAIRLVFGDPTSEIIFSSMERQIPLKKEEVGNKIDVFNAFLEKLLGSEQAQIIQAVGLWCLCFKLKHEYESVEECFSLLDTLYEVKLKLLVPSPTNCERSPLLN
jgi:hypothetical protein